MMVNLVSGPHGGLVMLPFVVKANLKSIIHTIRQWAGTGTRYTHLQTSADNCNGL